MYFILRHIRVARKYLKELEVQLK